MALAAMCLDFAYYGIDLFVVESVHFFDCELTMGLGCVAGSLTSCDSFLSAFQSKGLRPEAICPCASSSEALTVSIRRYVTHI